MLEFWIGCGIFGVLSTFIATYIKLREEFNAKVDFFVHCMLVVQEFGVRLIPIVIIVFLAGPLGVIFIWWAAWKAA